MSIILLSMLNVSNTTKFPTVLFGIEVFLGYISLFCGMYVTNSLKLVSNKIGDYKVYKGNLLSRKHSYVFFFFYLEASAEKLVSGFFSPWSNTVKIDILWQLPSFVALDIR